MEFKKYVSNLTHLESKKQFNSDVKEVILECSDDFLELNKDYNGFKTGSLVKIYTAKFVYFGGNVCYFYMNDTDGLPSKDAILELSKENFIKNVNKFLAKNTYLKEV